MTPLMKTLDSMVPSGPLPQKWERHRLTLKSVAPADRRTYRVIVVGTGLAGASAAAGRIGPEDA